MKNLLLENKFKTEKIYKSLYSPYYYTVKLKNLEISYLKMLHKEFLKKELVIELPKNSQLIF